MYTQRHPSLPVVPFVLALVLAAGCSQGTAKTESKPAAAAATEETPAADSAQAQSPRTPSTTATPVDVATGGTKFDPPVTPDQLPTGAWMCNMMGKVHYAAMAQGDGKCPTCGMKLTQHVPGSEQRDGHAHGPHAESTHE